MKTMKKYVYALMGAAMMMSIASCSQDVNALDGIEEVAADDEVMVTFEMGGEITASESALTRSEGSTDDLYGVIIYKDESEIAYGLFDDVSKIQYAMSKNSKYQIIVTMIKDGKNVVYRYMGYEEPFSVGVVGNVFKNGGSGKVSSFRSGYTRLSGTRSYHYYPSIDRFYGELNDFTPTEDCTVTLPLKRTAFGLKYKVSGITDGTVSVTIKAKSVDETFFTKSDITDTYTSEERIITFSDVYNAWAYADNYTDEITVSIQWARGVGVTEDLGTKTIRVKRNRMNVVNINLSANDGNAGLSVVLDDVNFTNEAANIHVE